MVLLSFWRPDRALIDPFCGTGTIPIEAAMIGRNLAPGLGRSFAAEAWPAIPASRWQAAREEARDRARDDLPMRIIGTDIDPEALAELAASIKALGLIQPLIVSEALEDAPAGIQYHLIAGERRLEASKLAGLERVQVIVKELLEAPTVA